jgi:hypothetical protein
VFTYVTGDGANLTALPGANITGVVANATHATSADSAVTTLSAVMCQERHRWCLYMYLEMVLI